MEQKGVLIIVLIILGGLFVLKSSAPASQGISGNAIRCEDQCTGLVNAYNARLYRTQRYPGYSLKLIKSCDQTICDTCSYEVTMSNQPPETVTVKCGRAYIDNRWIAPVGYSYETGGSPNPRPKGDWLKVMEGSGPAQKFF